MDFPNLDTLWKKIRGYTTHTVHMHMWSEGLWIKNLCFFSNHENHENITLRKLPAIRYNYLQDLIKTQLYSLTH